jgi:hypothetical protein
MRRILVACLLAGVVLGRPAPVRAHDAGTEIALAFGAATANLVYLPAKAIVALGGLVMGTFAGVMTGGSERAAYAFWVPAASGTYLLTPAKLDGTEPIEFFGSDYADHPSDTSAALEGAGIYETQYSR